MCCLAFTPSLPDFAHRVLTTADPTQKVQLTRSAVRALTSPIPPPPLPTPPDMPARPSRPLIVESRNMPSPRHSHAPHNVYLLHALAHVELNAVDLAFDTMLRFVPQNTAERDEWFRDWTSIAEDEARHYEWLCGRLNAHGWKYGDLPAHGLIWKGAKDSEDCVVRRLALGQLVAEARGLDASPRIAGKLVGMGDKESGKVVGKIAEEEVRHVQVGVKWYLRRVQGDGIQTFQEIALKYANGGSFNGGFNHEKRREAGLTPEWYEPVERMMKERNQAEKEKKLRMEEEEELKYRADANRRTRVRNEELFEQHASLRRKSTNEAGNGCNTMEES